MSISNSAESLLNSLDKQAVNLLHLCRLSLNGELTLSTAAKETIRQQASRISSVEPCLIRDHIIEICELGQLADAVRLMDDLDLLVHVFPEVYAMKEVFHDLTVNYHKEGGGDVYLHVLMVLDNAKKGHIAQISALLHDIGKPPTRKVGPETGRVRFKHHEPEGARMTEILLKRLQFDPEDVRKISKLVDMHTRPHAFGRDAVKPSQKAVRKLVRDAGDVIDDLLDLSEADCLGNIPVRNNVPQLRKRIQDLEPVQVLQREPAILSGAEIMTTLNLPSGGIIVGQISKALIALEAEYKENNRTLSKEEAYEFVRNF